MATFPSLSSEPIVPLTRAQFELLVKRGAIDRGDRLELLDGTLFRGTSAVPLSRVQFDLLVSPSRSEPFGLSIVEAMAAGVPVIATASEGEIGRAHV